jgi:ElaA protein
MLGRGRTVATTTLELEAKWFPELTLEELYGLLALRAEVFVVEQACAYLDPDGHDRGATHLLGRLAGELAAYARWYPEGERIRLGRIATAGGVRGRGLGRALVAAALRRIAADHPGRPVLVHAQSYLRSFYESLGFTTVGEPFDEDGIPHVAMVRPAG